MVNTTIILFTLLILLNIVFFCLGYLLGKTSNSQPIFGSQRNGIIRSNPNNPSVSKITIDDRKVVTDINLSGLEKKYENLGETVTGDNNISSSVNKLKNIKK